MRLLKAKLWSNPFGGVLMVRAAGTCVVVGPSEYAEKNNRYYLFVDEPEDLPFFFERPIVLPVLARVAEHWTGLPDISLNHRDWQWSGFCYRNRNRKKLRKIKILRYKIAQKKHGFFTLRELKLIKRRCNL